MEYEVIGDADSGPTLELDHTDFAYAGKFVTGSTGKLVARDTGDIVGAASFSPDRTTADRAWIRYLTVHREYRREGIGPRLGAGAASHLHDRGFETVAIGVNNPYAYHAMYRAGFGWSGETTGIAELVLTHPRDRSRHRYREGLTEYEGRDSLSDAEDEFITAHLRTSLPSTVDPPV